MADKVGAECTWGHVPRASFRKEGAAKNAVRQPSGPPPLWLEKVLSLSDTLPNPGIR